jgi:hypothetical protein
MSEDKLEISHEVEPEPIAKELPRFVPSVYLEVSKEQLDVLDVGKNVSIKLLGRVTGLRADENASENNRYSIDLELRKVSIIDDDNEFSKMAEDDD